MEENPYLLKILTGPHQGAEVALTEGEFSIGSGTDCDLILADALVAEEHARIVIAADGALLVLPLAQGTFVNGQEVQPGSTQNLKPFEFVSLSTTHFVVGPSEGEWPAISPADVPQMEKLTPSDSPEEPTEGEESDTPDSQDTPDSTEDESNTDTTPTQDEHTQHTITPLQILKNPLIIGSVAAMLLVFIGLILFLFSEEEQTTEEIQETLEEKVELALDKTGLTRFLDIEENTNGLLKVEGWLERNEDLDDVEGALNPFMPNIDLRVYSQEQIIESVEDVVAILKLPIEVHSMEPGKIRVSGYVGNTADWNKVKQEIENDVAGIQYLKDDVFTGERTYPILFNALKEKALADKIQAITGKNAITLTGVISKEEIPALKEAMSLFQSTMGFPIPIINQLQVQQADQIYLNAQIDSVTISDKGGVIMTKEGERLFVGGVLPGGYTIRAITREGIFLEKDGQEVKLKIGE